jgi:hypothetical protein
VLFFVLKAGSISLQWNLRVASVVLLGVLWKKSYIFYNLNQSSKDNSIARRFKN